MSWSDRVSCCPSRAMKLCRFSYSGNSGKAIAQQSVWPRARAIGLAAIWVEPVGHWNKGNVQLLKSEFIRRALLSPKWRCGQGGSSSWQPVHRTAVRCPCRLDDQPIGCTGHNGRARSVTTTRRPPGQRRVGLPWRRSVGRPRHRPVRTASVCSASGGRPRGVEVHLRNTGQGPTRLGGAWHAAERHSGRSGHISRLEVYSRPARV